MNALILQCGGPTAVINSSLVGIIAGLRERHGFAGRVFGARLGFRGLLQCDFADLTALTQRDLEQLRIQPGAALGSGRELLEDSAIPAALEILRAQHITEVYLIGGNGTMAAAHKLHTGALHSETAVKVIGVPKTIDNDLAGTDVCPGYASTAQFLISAVRDAALDLNSMRNFDDVVVFETMGRYSGWLAAASALARWSDNSPPHLTLVPEEAVDESLLLSAIQAQHARTGTCFIVVAEGVRDQYGTYLAEKVSEAGQDASGQKLLALGAGVAPYLAALVRTQLGLRCRVIRPDTLQRSASCLPVRMDGEIAYRAGYHAPSIDPGKMVSIRLGGTPHYEAVPLQAVVGTTRTLPPEFYCAQETGIRVTPAFIEYLSPLVPPHQQPPVLL